MKKIVKNHQAASLNSRSGVASVEFAVCLPVLLILVIGTIESCSMIYLKQTLHIAAYEGARRTGLADVTAADIEAACENVLTQRRVKDAKIEITPNGFDSQPPGTWINVRVMAQGSSNSVISGLYSDSLTVSGDAVMMKEH